MRLKLHLPFFLSPPCCRLSAVLPIASAGKERFSGHEFATSPQPLRLLLQALSLPPPKASKASGSRVSRRQLPSGEAGGLSGRLSEKKRKNTGRVDLVDLLYESKLRLPSPTEQRIVHVRLTATQHEIQHDGVHGNTETCINGQPASPSHPKHCLLLFPSDVACLAPESVRSQFFLCSPTPRCHHKWRTIRQMTDFSLCS